MKARSILERVRISLLLDQVKSRSKSGISKSARSSIFSLKRFAKWRSKFDCFYHRGSE